MSSQDKSNWARINHMADKEAEANALADPDCMPTNEDFWAGVKLKNPAAIHGAWQSRGHANNPAGHAMQDGIDPDIIEWFKKNSPEYHAAINSVLRQYIQAQQ